MKDSIRCIINADDFGLSESVNQAIVRSFFSGYITSASIMVGMPGFHEAVALAKEHALLNAIGIHLNVTEGYPTTEIIKRIPSLVDNNGLFRFLVSRSSLHLPPAYVAALHAEFSCQIETCIQAGITPTHIDSHHHIHNVWPVGAIVIDLAQKYRIPAVRIARNFGPGISFTKWIFKTFYNLRLRYHGIARTDLMGSFSDYIKQPPAPHLSVEIMVHPVLINGTIIDSMENEVLSHLIEKTLS